MAISEVPLQPSQSQAFTIALNGIVYGMRVQWRDAASTWIMDLSDSNGQVLVAGQPLLPGADIMHQYVELALGGELWIATDGEPDAPPTFDNLGVASHLYFVTRD